MRTVTGGSKSTTGAEVWHVPSFCVVREDTMARGARVGLWAPPLTNQGPSVAVSWRLRRVSSTTASGGPARPRGGACCQKASFAAYPPLMTSGARRWGLECFKLDPPGGWLAAGYIGTHPCHGICSPPHPKMEGETGREHHQTRAVLGVIWYVFCVGGLRVGPYRRLSAALNQEGHSSQGALESRLASGAPAVARLSMGRMASPGEKSRV